MKQILFAVLLTLCFTGCFKRDERHVNAPCKGNCISVGVRVTTDTTDNIPVPKAAVELGWRRPAEPLGDPGRLIATGTTGADGFVSFSFTPQEKELTGGIYYVNVTKGNDYFRGGTSVYGVYRGDTSLTMPVHLYSKATIVIVYKNFAPADSADYFECSPGVRSYHSDAFPLDMSDSKGTPTNTFWYYPFTPFTELTLHGETAGDDYTYLSVLRTKNGNRQQVRDSIYIHKGESRTYAVSW